MSNNKDLIRDLFARAAIPTARILFVHTCLRSMHRRTGIGYPELSTLLLEELCNTRPRALLIPVFTIYSFMAIGIFHLRHARSEVGRFSEEMRRRGFTRTPDPMYSVLDVLDALPAGLDFTRTYGTGTLFDYLRRENAIIVNVDMGAFYATPIHDIERTHRVPYRYELTFQGMMQLGEEPWSKISYQAFVRKVAREWSGSYPPYNHRRRLEYLRQTDVLTEAANSAGQIAWTDLDSFYPAIDRALQRDQLFLIDPPRTD